MINSSVSSLYSTKTNTTMKANYSTLTFILTIFSTAISQEIKSPGVFGKGILNFDGKG